MEIVESNRSLERKEEREENRKGKQSCILLGRFVVLSPIFWGFLGAKAQRRAGLG